MNFKLLTIFSIINLY